MNTLAFSLVLSIVNAFEFPTCANVKNLYQSQDCCHKTNASAPLSEEPTFCPGSASDYFVDSQNATVNDDYVQMFDKTAMSFYDMPLHRIARKECQQFTLGYVKDRGNFNADYHPLFAGSMDYINYAKHMGLIDDASECLDVNLFNFEYSHTAFISAWGALMMNLNPYNVLVNPNGTPEHDVFLWRDGKVLSSTVSGVKNTKISVDVATELAKESPHPFALGDPIVMLAPGYGEMAVASGTYEHAYIGAPSYDVGAETILRDMVATHCSDTSVSCTLVFVGMTFSNEFGTVYLNTIAPLVGSTEAHLPLASTAGKDDSGNPLNDHFGCVGAYPKIIGHATEALFTQPTTTENAEFPHVKVIFQPMCVVLAKGGAAATIDDVLDNHGDVKAINFHTWQSDKAIVPELVRVAGRLQGIGVYAGRWSLSTIASYDPNGLLNGKIKKFVQFNPQAQNAFWTSLHGETLTPHDPSALGKITWANGVFTAAIMVRAMQIAKADGHALPMTFATFNTVMKSLGMTTSQIFDMGLEGMLNEFQFSETSRGGHTLGTLVQWDGTSFVVV